MHQPPHPPSYEDLSITPTLSSPTLSRPLSPEPALSPPPASPDISTEDTPNQSIDLMNDTIDYYEVEPAPAPPPHTRRPGETPIQCYDRDVILEGDIENGWERLEIDEIPDHGPFLVTPGLDLDTESRKPEDFFNNVFDDRMFTVIADATNNYAHKKIRSLLEDRDAFQQLEHQSHRRHARMSTWKDMNAADINIFIAHLLVMCLVKKPVLHNYWSTTSLFRTPFFGQYFSRNHFQDILWNLHCVTLQTTQLLESQITTHWQKSDHLYKCVRTISNWDTPRTKLLHLMKAVFLLKVRWNFFSTIRWVIYCKILL